MPKLRIDRSAIHAVILIVLSRQIGSAQTWSEWVAKGNELARSGNQSAAIEAFGEACSSAKPGINLTDRQFVGVLNALALAYLDTGQYAQAEHQWRRAAAVVEKSQGVESLDYALLLSSLAGLPTFGGNHEEMATILRRAIAKNRQTGPARDLALIRVGLAQLLIAQEQYGPAEAVLEDALADLAGMGGAASEELANVWNTLGSIRYKEGHLAESLDPYREEIRQLETAFGDKHAYLIAPLNNLATSLTKFRRLGEARAAYERAAGICETTVNRLDGPCGLLLENYATVLSGLGYKKEAKHMAMRGRAKERNSDRTNGSGWAVDAGALRGK